MLQPRRAMKVSPIYVVIKVRLSMARLQFYAEYLGTFFIADFSPWSRLEIVTK